MFHCHQLPFESLQGQQEKKRKNPTETCQTSFQHFLLYSSIQVLWE